MVCFLCAQNLKYLLLRFLPPQQNTTDVSGILFVEFKAVKK